MAKTRNLDEGMSCLEQSKWIVNKYVKGKQIGTGAMGCAWLVRTRDGQTLVAKEINVQGMSAKDRAEAVQEADVLRQLQHTNIISMYEAFVDGPSLFIVMEFADAGDLAQLLRNAKGRRFPEARVLNLFFQICQGLFHVHSHNILHRDLKTANILLTSGGVIKLADFGLARIMSSGSEMARTQIGTPYYLSPEICEDKPYNHKSDIWALGCVLYELIMLKHAFEGQSLPALAMKIVRGQYTPLPLNYSSGLRALVSSTLRTDPASRPSVAEILQAPVLQAHLRPETASLNSKAKQALHEVASSTHIPIPTTSGNPRTLGGRPLLSPRPGSQRIDDVIDSPSVQDAATIHQSDFSRPSAVPLLNWKPFQEQDSPAHTDDWMAHMHARIGAVKDCLQQAPPRRHSPTTPSAQTKSGGPRAHAPTGNVEHDHCGAQIPPPNFSPAQPSPTPDDSPSCNSRMKCRPATVPRQDLSPRPGGVAAPGRIPMRERLERGNKALQRVIQDREFGKRESKRNDAKPVTDTTDAVFENYPKIEAVVARDRPTLPGVPHDGSANEAPLQRRERAAAAQASRVKLAQQLQLAQDPSHPTACSAQTDDDAAGCLAQAPSAMPTAVGDSCAASKGLKARQDRARFRVGIALTDEERARRKRLSDIQPKVSLLSSPFSPRGKNDEAAQRESECRNRSKGGIAFTIGDISNSSHTAGEDSVPKEAKGRLKGGIAFTIGDEEDERRTGRKGVAKVHEAAIARVPNADERHSHGASEAVGGPPSGPGGVTSCPPNESRTVLSEKVKRRAASDIGVKCTSEGASLSDIIRKGRECRRETGINVEVVVLAPPVLPSSYSASVQGTLNPVNPLQRIGSNSKGSSGDFNVDMSSRSESIADNSFKVMGPAFNVDKAQGSSQAGKGRDKDSSILSSCASMERDSLDLGVALKGDANRHDLAADSCAKTHSDYASKIETMRQQCENLLGLDLFLKVYQQLRNSTDASGALPVETLSEVGERRLGGIRDVLRLIQAEDKLFLNL